MTTSGRPLRGRGLPSWMVPPARRAAAAVLRRTPPSQRGLQRALDLLDDTLRGGASPLVVAPMALGYKMILDLRSRTEFAAYYTGRYDTDLIRAARGLVPQGGVALDVGANVGFWSVALAQVAHVHAFEPVTANANRIEENAALNGVQGSLTVHRTALSDESGAADITLREDFARGAGTGNASLVTTPEDAQFGRLRISLTTLDEWAAAVDLRRVDVVKVDIEGYEDKFLSGARKTLERFRPSLWVEWNREYYARRDVDPTAVVGEALTGLGYQFLRRTDDGWADEGAFHSPAPIDDLVLVAPERAPETAAALSCSASTGA